MADGSALRGHLSCQGIAVNTKPDKTVEPRKSFTFEAVPEDEETQEELNRSLRKPGEPGFGSLPKNGEAGNSAPPGEPRR
jgi:hypothetical protein